MDAGWPRGSRGRCSVELRRGAVFHRLDAAGAGPDTRSGRASRQGTGRSGRNPVLDATPRLKRLGKRRNRRKSLILDHRPRLHRLLLAEPNPGRDLDLITNVPRGSSSFAPARSAHSEAPACRLRHPLDSAAPPRPVRPSRTSASSATRSCARRPARPSAGAARPAGARSPTAPGRRIIVCATRLPVRWS